MVTIFCCRVSCDVCGMECVHYQYVVLGNAQWVVDMVVRTLRVMVCLLL